MKNRVTTAVVCLRISAAIYLLLGLYFLRLPFAPEFGYRLPAAFGVVGLVVCAALTLGTEALVAGLRRRRIWDWVAGSRAVFRIGVQDAGAVGEAP